MRFNVGDKVELVPFEEARKIVDKDIQVTQHWIHGIHKGMYEMNRGRVFTISIVGYISYVLAEDPMQLFWPMECFKEATPQLASDEIESFDGAYQKSPR